MYYILMFILGMIVGMLLYIAHPRVVVVTKLTEGLFVVKYKNVLYKLTRPGRNDEDYD